jgi:hypothetical protein
MKRRRKKNRKERWDEKNQRRLERLKPLEVRRGKSVGKSKSSVFAVREERASPALACAEIKKKKKKMRKKKQKKKQREDEG